MTRAETYTVLVRSRGGVDVGNSGFDSVEQCSKVWGGGCYEVVVDPGGTGWDDAVNPTNKSSVTNFDLAIVKQLNWNKSAMMMFKSNVCPKL